MDTEATRSADSVQTNASSTDILKASDVVSVNSSSSCDSSLVHVSQECSFSTVVDNVNVVQKEKDDKSTESSAHDGTQQFPESSKVLQGVENPAESSRVLQEVENPPEKSRVLQGVEKPPEHSKDSQVVENLPESSRVLQGNKLQHQQNVQQDGTSMEMNIADISSPESFVVLDGNEDSLLSSPHQITRPDFDILKKNNLYEIPPSIAADTCISPSEESERKTKSSCSSDSILVLSTGDFQSSDTVSVETTLSTPEKDQSCQNEEIEVCPKTSDKPDDGYANSAVPQVNTSTEKCLKNNDKNNEESDEKDDNYDIPNLSEVSGLSSLLTNYRQNQKKYEERQESQNMFSASNKSGNGEVDKLEDTLDLSADYSLLSEDTSLLGNEQNDEEVESVLRKMPDVEHLDPNESLDDHEKNSKQKHMEGDQNVPIKIYPPVGRSFSFVEAEEEKKIEDQFEVVDKEIDSGKTGSDKIIDNKTVDNQSQMVRGTDGVSEEIVTVRDEMVDKKRDETEVDVIEGGKTVDNKNHFAQGNGDVLEEETVQAKSQIDLIDSIGTNSKCSEESRDTIDELMKPIHEHLLKAEAMNQSGEGTKIYSDLFQSVKMEFSLTTNLGQNRMQFDDKMDEEDSSYMDKTKDQPPEDKGVKKFTVADSLTHSFSLLASTSSVAKDTSNSSHTEKTPEKRKKEKEKYTNDVWSFPDRGDIKKEYVPGLSVDLLRGNIKTVLKQFRDEKKDLHSEPDLENLTEVLEKIIWNSSSEAGTTIQTEESEQISAANPINVEIVTTISANQNNDESEDHLDEEEQDIMPKIQTTNEGSLKPCCNGVDTTVTREADSSTNWFSLAISEQQARLFKAFDGEKVIKHNYEVDVRLDLENMKVGLKGNPLNVNTALKVINNNEWLSGYIVRSEKFDSVVIELLCKEETRNYIDSEILASVKFSHCWNIFKGLKSIVIHAGNADNAGRVAEIIRRSVQQCTQILPGGEECLASSEWYHWKTDLHKRFQGKLQIYEVTKDLDGVMFVCTSDILPYIKQEFYSIQKTMTTTCIQEELKTSKNQTDTTDKIEMKEEMYMYITRWFQAEIDEVSSDLDIQLSVSSICDPRYIFLKGDKKNLDTVKNYILNLMEQTEMSQQVLKSNEAIRIFQQNNFQVLKVLEQRHKCCITVHQEGVTAESTPNAELPVTNMVDTDSPGFTLHGIGINVICQKTTNIDTEVCVQPTDALETTVYGQSRVVYCENHKKNCVKVIVPDWDKPDERGRFVGFLVELFNDLQRFSVTSVCFPIKKFQSLPFEKLTNAVLMALNSFSQANVHLKTVVFCDPDPEICQSISNIVQETLVSNKGTASETLQENSTAKGTTTSSGIKIIVEKGEIAKQKVDVIVNTTSKYLDLNQGGVSLSISNMAGSEMQREVKELYPGGIEFGEVVSSSPFQLDCKTVFHGALQPWPQYFSANTEKVQCLKVLSKFVWECLTKANLKKFKTVAFPALGTGNLSFPPLKVADEMMETIQKFGDKHPRTTLETVKVIIYQKDTNNLKIFEDKLRSHEKKYKRSAKPPVHSQVEQPKSPSTVASNPLELSVNIGNMQLCAGLGDVSKQQGYDGIVMIWLSDKRFSAARKDDPLLKSARKGSKDYGTQDFKMSQRQMYVTPAGDLPQKKIIHVYGNGSTITKVFSMAFDLAEKENDLSSLIIPLRVSDPMSENCKEYTKAIYMAMKNLASQQKHRPCLKKVKICIAGQHLISPVISALKELDHENKNDIFKPTEVQPLIVCVTANKDVIPDIIIDLDNPQLFDIPPLDDPRSICGDEEVEILNVTRDIYEGFLFFERQYLQKLHSEVNMSYKRDGDKILLSGPKDITRSQAREIESLLKELSKTICIDIVDVPQRYLVTESLSQMVGRHQQYFIDVLLYVPDSKSNMFQIIGLTHQRVQETKESIVKSLDLVSSSEGCHSEACGMTSPLPVDSRFDVGTFFTPEGIQIYVYKESILRVPVDCIVNAANSYLDHGGGIAHVISTAAGAGFRQECKDYIGKHGTIPVGECCHTGAGELPYACVIHTVGPEWKEKKSQECVQQLQRAVEACIKKASSLGMTSVGIPAISSGIFGIPLEICAEQYAIGAVSASSSLKSTNSTLKEIHFVDCVPETVAVIKHSFGNFFRNIHITVPSSVTIAVDNSEARVVDVTETTDLEGADLKIKIEYPMMSSYYSSRNIHITQYELKKDKKVLVYTGDILKSKVHAIAFGEDPHLHHRGHIASKMKELGGKPYLKNVKDEKNRRKPIKHGDVLPIDTGNTLEYTCFALLAITPSFGADKISDAECLSKILKCYVNVLHEAVKLGVHSLAVPLLGTGNDRKRNEVAATLHTQIIDFFKDLSPECPLKEVHIINKNKEATHTLTDLFFNYVTSRREQILCEVQHTVAQHKRGSNYTFLSQHNRDGHTSLTQHNRGGHTSLTQHNRGGHTSLTQHNRGIDSRGGHTSLALYTKGIGCKDGHTSLTSGIDNVSKQTEESVTGLPEEKRPTLDESIETSNITCVICMDHVDENFKVLSKCSHIFCADCIEMQFQFKPVCPTCGTVYGVVRGNQPEGYMKVDFSGSLHLPGFEEFGAHVITYNFGDGTQGADHPNPGQEYEGTLRVAYIPDSPKGKIVLKLLKVSFERKLTFTIGHSRTTGRDNVVTWNDIHHKTKTHGGPECFGYPDPDYLDRVLDELAAKGVTEESLTQDF